MDLKIDILTSRKYEKRPWFDLVYEWEDEIKELLNCKLIYEPTIFKKSLKTDIMNSFHWFIILC